MGIKTFDVASMVIEEANDRFAPIWEPNEEKCRILEQYCGAIDALIKDFDGESLDVEVDEIKMTICIQIECADMTIEACEHKYFELIQRANSFGFKATGNDTMLVEFVFPSIWDKTM